MSNSLTYTYFTSSWSFCDENLILHVQITMVGGGLQTSSFRSFSFSLEYNEDQDHLTLVKSDS